MTAAVALARTDDERQAVYRFRYRVYVEEMGLSLPEADHAGRRPDPASQVTSGRSRCALLSGLRSFEKARAGTGCKYFTASP